MKDIKKLLEEQGLMFHHDGETTRTVWLEDIEAAFAKALQGDVGEPVAECLEDGFLNGTIKMLVSLGDIPVGSKLYTSPPNTQARLDKAIKGLKAMEALINESRGVAGLHLNGDIATWDELRTGGRFEEWLVDFDEALKELE